MPITTPSTVDQPADNDNRVRGSRTAARAGWVLTSLVVLFLLIDGITHVLKIQPVLDSFRDLGFPASTAAGIGIIELVCLALHVVPRTSVLGALLLTAYLVLRQATFALLIVSARRTTLRSMGSVWWVLRQIR